MTTRATKVKTKAKRATTKKTAPKKASKAKSATTKKRTAKKAAAKKTAPKKAAKKAASTKAATKKTTTKAATKKTTTKAATKKTTSKAATSKPATSKAATSKTSAARPARAPKQAGLLAADVEKALLGKFKKARFEYDVEQALESLVPDGLDHGAVLWDLALRGRLPLDKLPVVDEFMGWPAPSPEALVQMWNHVQPAWIAEHPTQMPGAPYLLFAVAYNAIEKDPAPWREAVATLPEPLRGAVWLELAELGAVELPPDVLAELRARLLTDPFERLRTAVDHNLRVLGLDDPTIARELLQRLPEGRSVELADVEVVLRHADIADVTRLVTATRPGWRDAELLGKVLRERSDDVDALVRLATAVRAAFGRDNDVDKAVQAIVDVALERSQAAGVAPPAALDELVTFAWDKSPYAAPALAALPRERLQALIRRELHEDEMGRSYRVFPAVRHAFDEALFGEVLDAARDAAQGSTGRSNIEPLALGAVGPQAIPALERALATALTDTTFERDYHKNRWVTQLRKAIAVALLEVAAAGEELDGRWDALLGPHPECLDWNIIDEVFNGDAFGKLLALLPEARARAILDAWLAADPNARHNVRDWLERELPESSKHLLAPAERLIDRLRRLVDETGLAPDTRIYALEPHDACEPTSANRVCSAPLGLADDRWPRHGDEKMEHVLTLDLDQTPELRRLAPELADARAMALFISSRSENSAYSAENDETALLGLSAEELAAGHDEEGGSFAVHALDVPRAVFEENTDGPLGELRSALWKLHGRVLGAPFWVQGDEWFEPLMLQFDEGLASINLGDSGVMYVFPSTAFWQCY